MFPQLHLIQLIKRLEGEAIMRDLRALAAIACAALASCQMLNVTSNAEVSAEAAKSEKPNILVILSDDAGYADFGFHGSKIMKTPRLDAFAKQSMKFSQAYVTAAVCGPSRAGLYTGKYQQRFGYEENNVPGFMSASGALGDDMGLPLDEVTIGDYLKAEGYYTGIIGKWHLGNADRFHPLKRGFDYFFGFRGGARSYFELSAAEIEKKPEDQLERGFGKFEKPQKYLTDQFADEAIDFINRERSEPFFLMLSFTAVHGPMEATEADLAAFPKLKGKRKTLAAMNLAMDRAIGNVLDELDAKGLSDNTLVIYTNDNGGPSDNNASVNSPLRGTKANHLEGGIRVPFLMRWPNVVEENSTFSDPISTLDLLPTFVAAAEGNLGGLDDVDGVNLIPHVRGATKQAPHDILFWKKENRGAVREGDWKLLRFPDRPAELYNIAEDESELNNLANLYPEKVRDMYQKLFDWELTLERPLWQLKRKYEGAAMKRMDDYRTDPYTER